MRHIFVLLLSTIITHGALAQEGIEPTDPTTDGPDTPPSVRRTAFDNYWDLLGRWGRGEDLTQENIKRLAGVSDIIFNELDRHPRLQYLNRLDDIGYAAYARIISNGGSRETLKLEVMTNPSEALEGLDNSSTEMSQRSGAGGGENENQALGGWGSTEPARDSSSAGSQRR